MLPTRYNEDDRLTAMHPKPSDYPTPLIISTERHDSPAEVISRRSVSGISRQLQILSTIWKVQDLFLMPDGPEERIDFERSR
jgi:hypothetical protein